MLTDLDTSVREAVSREAFANALSCFANGVTILTTAGPAGRFGRTVSSACSLCATPPAVLACVNRAAPIADAVVTNGAFCINAASEAQRAVCEVFAGQPPMPMADRFEHGEWVDVIGTTPGLLGAAAVVGCRLATYLDFGSHRILIGVVCETQIGSLPPLVHHRRSFAGIAPFPD
jgi:flavin reductase (DIM6/NTAB) family NADH-FMN oxidoreductase RutF